MPITYLTLTQDEMDLRIIRNVRAREEEYFHYTLNASNYAELLDAPDMKALPEEWPENLARLKKLNRDEVIEQVKDETEMQLIQKLQLRDRLRALQKAEALEASRVEKYHGQLVDKLPKVKAQLDALILKEKTEREKKV